VEIGIIGLGRMGGNMAERLRRGGHTVVGYDQSAPTRDVDSLEALVAALEAPRAVWVMVPAGKPTQETITALGELLAEGDIVIDGGNSKWTDDIKHSQQLDAKKIGFIDCGVSGGIWGLTEGYALMCGGSDEHVARIQPIFDTLKPQGDFGFVHAGEVGAGHFVKMVHNGIEYGMMQAYAEGFDIFKNATSKDLPEEIRYDLNLADIAEVWRRGSVVSSWLLDLTAIALAENPTLSEYSGFVQDSGEGRWTIQAAIEESVPAEVLTASLYTRFRSRQEHTFAEKMLSAMRQKFGGHVEPKAQPKK